jgi:hypothetical protein
MRTFISSCLLLLACFSYADTIRLSEPVEKDAHSETFGAPYDASLKTVSLAQLLEDPAPHLQEAFNLETRVAKVCQKKGCFFIAQENDLTLRIAFKDYGFFIPTDSSNKVVNLTGVLVEKQMSKEQAEHFKSDIGESDDDSTLQAGTVLEIVASSVKIPIS